MNDVTLTLSQRLVSLGLSALVQVTIILVAGLLAGRLTQKRGPAWQSLAYRATLAATFLSVIVTLLAGGHIPERVSFSSRVAPAVSRPDRFVKTIYPPITIEDVGGGESAVAGPAPVQPSYVHTPQSRRWTLPSGWPWILAGALWLGGAISVAMRSVAGSFALLRLRKTASPVTAGPAVEIASELSAQLKIAPPPLRTHPKIRGPFLAGLRRPAIYLPSDYAEQYGASTLRAVLSHELAHMVRKDCAWLSFQQILNTIFWFHPLYHAASNRLIQAAEEACDAIVVSLDCPPQEYAASLLALVERSQNRREPAHTLGVTPIRSSVGKRIRLILDRSRQAAIRVPAWGLAITAVTVVSLAGLAIAIFCPAEAGWRLAAKASVVGVTPPVSWTPDPNYASHFRLAREHGWSMAPARGIALIDRPNGFENSIRTAIPDSDLALMKACRSTWSVDVNSDRYLSPDRAPLSLRGRIEKVLADHPHYFYAEYRLAIWYASHRDFGQYRLWRDRALADAPAVLAGRVQYDDGRPVAGMEYAPFFLYRATDSDHESDFSPTPEDIAITDEDGCYYVPVYRALYDDLGSTVDGPSDPVFTTLKKSSVMTRQYLHRIVIDRQVGLMPPVYIRPYMRFTGPYGAVKGSWKKPMHVSDTRINVSWTAPPGTTRYYIFFVEGILRGGKLLGDRMDPLGDTSYGLETTSPSMTLDFMGRLPIFGRGRTYKMTVVAFHGDERLSETRSLYFTPDKALAPMPVTGPNVEAAIPYTRVQSVSQENGRTVVKGVTRVLGQTADDVVFRQLFNSSLVKYDLPHYIKGQVPQRHPGKSRPFTLEFTDPAKPAQ